MKRSKATPCRKMKYANRATAIGAHRRTGSRADVNVYWCAACKAWHLGHSKNHYRVQKRLDQILDR